MIIYLDIYFFKNFLFNFLLLYLTSFLIRKRTKWYRLLLASIIGGCYAIAALHFEKVFQSHLLKILMALIMLLISYGKKQILNNISNFCIISYFIAGVIASLLNVHNEIVLVILSIVTLVLFVFYHKETKKQNFYEIEIDFLGNKINLKAKLDTGNELKDSLFGDAVIVVSEDSIKDELNNEIICILKNERLEIPRMYQNKIRLITFRTIAEEGIKTGIKLDSVIIYTKKQEIENQAILILTDKKFNQYDALIGLNLLEGAYQFQK